MEAGISQELCPHGSVGAVIRNKEGKYLMLSRLSYPPGLAGIAGHVDEGETPEEALVREVAEECGLIVEAKTLLFHGTVNNPCKRGFASHKWWVYDVTAWSGEPRLMEPEKHAFVRWMTPSEMRDMIEKGEVDPAWNDPSLRTLILKDSCDLY